MHNLISGTGEQEKVYRDCLLFKDLTQGGVHHPCSLLLLGVVVQEHACQGWNSPRPCCSASVGKSCVNFQQSASMRVQMPLLQTTCEGVLCRAAFCNDVLVGAVAVRLERQPDGKVRLYFVTLGVLAAYRNYGVGEPPHLLSRDGHHAHLP